MKYYMVIAVVLFTLSPYAASPRSPFSPDQYTVALWHFDENAGDSVFDASGHGNSGRIYGAKWIQGLFGPALQFGGGDSVKVLDNSSQHLQTVTVEAWIYSDDFTANNYGVVLTKEYSDMASYRLQNFQTTGGMTFVTNSNWGDQIESETPLQNQAWHHVAGVASNGYLKLYLDGALIASGARDPSISYDDSPILIGVHRLVSTSGFKGIIDEVRISSIDRFGPLPISIIPYSPNPTYNQRPVLRWHADSAVSIYRIQIDTSRYFSSPVFSIPTADTFFTPGINLSFGNYYWRVCDDADASTWSTVSSFAIQDSLVPMLIPYSPDPTRNRKPVLMWHQVHGATAYTIQIYRSTIFSTPYLTDGAADTFYSPATNLPTGPIYWRVSSNVSTQYSAFDTVTVLNDSIPELIPMTPDTQYNRKPQFKWHASTGGPTYVIQIDSTGTFYNPFIILPVNDTTYTPLVNLPVGRIFWRVGVELNSVGYSSVDTFRIAAGVVNGKLNDENKTAGSIVVRNVPKGIVITYEKNDPGAFSVNIYTVTGACIASFKALSKHLAIMWNGTDKNGTAMPMGNYIAVCTTHDQQIGKRIMLIR